MLVVHTVSGALALLIGFYVLCTAKGTRAHRRWGQLYSAAMYVLCFTSFGLYAIGGLAGTIFHVMSVVNAALVTVGWSAARWQLWGPRWFRVHFHYMSYSYYGLLMATDSHLLGYLPPWPLWAKAVLLWVLPYFIARALIQRNYPRYAARFAPAVPAAPLAV